jgi:Carboxypeptidase regulatory-like domain
MKIKKTVLFGLFFAVLVATAQTETGSMGGFVKDPSGGVVPKARVTIKNEGTSAIQTLTTDSAG